MSDWVYLRNIEEIKQSLTELTCAVYKGRPMTELLMDLGRLRRAVFTDVRRPEEVGQVVQTGEGS